MTGFAKFLVGAAATSLLAFGAHQMGGPNYIDGLEGDAQTAFAGLSLPDGASVSMLRDPLSRIAVVEGDYDDATREKIRAALMAVPGMAGVRFTRGGDGDAGNQIAAAKPEAVTNCQTNVDQVMAGKVITFNSGSAYMPDSSIAIVDEVAGALKDCAGLNVAVGGHTDATGSADINQKLSQARADAVATALAERGVAAERITATGYGSTQPKVEGDGANEANRRIEFTISAANEGEE